MVDKRNNNRLVEIDALRGLAALSVVLFHYTTRFNELYVWNRLPMISFPDGHFGVNLFFIISGFVIFMTLDKTSRPMDFVVSRFSRLFPAYWVSILLTFSITHWLGLPEKLVGWTTALANLPMIHGLFHIPHVDSVYWTLEIELLFYFGMFILYRMRCLDRIHQALLTLLAFRLVYFILDRFWGIQLPWTVSHLLILQFIPWFSIGISIYLFTKPNAAERRKEAGLIAFCAIFCLLVVDSVFLAFLATALASAVLLAASGKAFPLRHPVLVWLGSISYPLYLLHENIGWSLLLQLKLHGIPTDVAICTAIAATLVMATVLTKTIEQPAMRWIRNRYRMAYAQ